MATQLKRLGEQENGYSLVFFTDAVLNYGLEAAESPSSQQTPSTTHCFA